MSFVRTDNTEQFNCIWKENEYKTYNAKSINLIYSCGKIIEK